MGIRTGALLRAFLAILNAFSWSEGRAPHDFNHRESRATWNDIAATGKSMEARSRWRVEPDDRQSGNPGPSGRPAARIALRSGGKANPNSASALANSTSDKPLFTWTPEFFRCAMTFPATELKSRRLCREGTGVEGAEAAALAERRRRPAK